MNKLARNNYIKNIILNISDVDGNGYYDVKDFLDMKNEEILKENGNKRWDICLMNPPYGNLGELFFEKSLDISDITITIQPLNWLITSKKQNEKITNIINIFGCNIEQINGNKYFDVGIAGNLSINYINKLVKSEIIFDGIKFDKCDDIKKYSTDNYLLEFNDSIKNIENTCFPHLTFFDKLTEHDSGYCICIARIRGHVTSNTNNEKRELKDFYTFISNNNKKVHAGKIADLINKKIGESHRTFIFNSGQELNNFINYIKTDFVRSILLIYKNNMNINLEIFKHMPWFDFSDEHFNKSPKEIDDWLFKKYNISDEIRKHIEEILPDYYGIRK